jgi:hypothetical protein
VPSWVGLVEALVAQPVDVRVLEARQRAGHPSYVAPPAVHLTAVPPRPDRDDESVWVGM